MRKAHAYLLALLFLTTAAMAQFQTLQSYGPVTINAGADDYLPSSAGVAIAANTSQVLVRNQQVSWPLTGGQGLDFFFEYSPDNGATWIFIDGDSIDDIQQGGSRGVPLGETRWGSGVPDVGNVNRRLRVHYHFYKRLRVSGTIEVQ